MPWCWVIAGSLGTPGDRKAAQNPTAAVWHSNCLGHWHPISECLDSSPGRDPDSSFLADTLRDATGGGPSNKVPATHVGDLGVTAGSLLQLVPVLPPGNAAVLASVASPHHTRSACY